MIRFWVEKPTIDFKSYKVDELMDFIQSKLKKEYNLNIITLPIPFKKRFKYWFKSYRVSDYLKEWKLVAKQSLLDNFDLRDDYKIENLGYNQLKLLSLLKLFSNKGISIFDFYGVDPHGEEKLVNYIKTRLPEGHTVIAFDDLNFKQRVSDDKYLRKIVIKRKR